jgi:hypothetical protein
MQINGQITINNNNKLNQSHLIIQFMLLVELPLPQLLQQLKLNNNPYLFKITALNGQNITVKWVCMKKLPWLKNKQKNNNHHQHLNKLHLDTILEVTTKKIVIFYAMLYFFL